MKKKSILYILVACLSVSVISCEDMLTPSSDRHSYEVGQDTLYSYWGILRSLQNVGERYVILGECRGELLSGTSYLSDTIQAILNFDMENAIDGSCRYLKASDYYHVINSCNAYLAYYDSTLVTGTKEPYMEKEAAQIQAIRAWVYLQLVQVYGKVPFYTEPLLSTDDIDAFWNNGNHPTATADNLADLLVDGLEDAATIEMTYGYPQYQSYGYTSTVCHSTKAMIPLNLILGDLYLIKGDVASCEKAAQYYYNYLSANQNMSNIAAGGALPSGYFCYGYMQEGATQTTYKNDGSDVVWTETGAQSRTAESITAIPSSTNKLWGTVLRGVNELYGYDAEISVRTGQDSTTTASVSLTAQYDKKQLVASNAYYDLCAAQQFEMYVGSDYNTCNLNVDPSVGDARQYWVQDVMQTYSNGITNTEKFITKQNPDGKFTTVFPMIYRKSQVWLRYAEALCGAGYPSYAFAILKDGLCNSSSWFPTPETSDYAVKEWEFSYVDEDGASYTSTTSKDDVVSQVMAGLTFEDEDEYEAMLDEVSSDVDSVALSYQNWPSENTNAVLDYIDAREVAKAGSYLNFNFTTFNGNYSSTQILLRTSLSDNGGSLKTGNEDVGSYTDGIHSRGCGYVKYVDRHGRTYNYVDMVSQKAKENYGLDLSKEDIYNGEYDDIVQMCVEDLIVDEEALELAFEGTRFFDLMRVARRRNDPSYLANKLALRNESLRTKLLNENNWYFPLPTY